MFVVGLTGDVGAGKSSLVETWRAQGASVVNADEIAKEQWRRPEVLKSAVARWGSGILKDDGFVDFSAVAGKVFADDAEYAYMNALIHPWTRMEMSRRIANLRGWAVAEIPLLFEAGRHEWIDYVVYVTASEETRIARNLVRGWDKGEISRRERFLMNAAEKRNLSDIVLENEGDAVCWAKTAEKWGRVFKEMASTCELVTYCASREEAETISRSLVENGLAACVNVSETESRYLWKGEVCQSREWMLSGKTTLRLLHKAKNAIKTLHSYDLPAIVVREFWHADAETLKWIADSCEMTIK